MAHRGASGLAPENTLEALQLAVELGARWAEVDVQCTVDGVAVLVHDDNWQRTSGRNLPVRETPWSTVHNLDVGIWFGRCFAGARPPTLVEVLKLTHSGLQLNLEIKSPHNDASLASKVVDSVRRYAVQEHVLLTSFDHACIDDLAESATDLCLGYLARQAIRRMHPAVRTLSVSAELLLDHPGMVQEAQAEGRRLWVWTVDDPVVVHQFVEAGVDGIITNHPERFLR